MLRARVLPTLLAFLAGMTACGEPAADELDPDPLVVPAWWIPGADGLNWEQARAGLWWALSNLGAAPPADEAGLVVEEESDDGVVFTLDLGAVGFPEASLPAVEAAVAPVRAHAAVEGPVDVGRLLMATLYEPGRYYAITGACPTTDAWRAARQAPEPERYAVTVSLLVAGDRAITFNPAPAGSADVSALGWMAEEGEGSLADGTFRTRELETVDVMANGQQRFAVYGEDGALRAAAAESPAGQPGKCMWCHEGNVQRGTAENPSAEGYLTYAEFAAEVDAAEAVLAAARGATPTAVDWDPATHEWAEHLTVALLEPSPERVAREWGVSVEEVRALALPTHTHGEYPQWGELYDRADVDAARVDREPGWAPLTTPPSDRELGADWPLMGVEGLDCAPVAGRAGPPEAR